MFTKDESETIFRLAAELTGSNQTGRARRDSLVGNVARRMQSLAIHSLADYLELVFHDPKEYQELISCLTIHTTSWFRETPHFALTKKLLAKFHAANGKKTFRVWCSACSTGEEVFSFGLLMEQFRLAHPGFEYQILGTDIDAISITSARSAIYSVQGSDRIPPDFRSLLLLGSGKSEGYFTLAREVRERCRFGVFNLVAENVTGTPAIGEKFDLIVCRNVLIYFTPEQVVRVVATQLKFLAPGGMLCLGHSESVDAKALSLELIANSFYSRAKGGGETPVPVPVAVEEKPQAKKVFLIIDDSLTVRQILLKLMKGSEFEGVAVSSAKEATNYLKKNKVDLISLDLHMPEEDGATWLKHMRKDGMRTPVFIVSDANPAEAHAVLGALETGAQDFLEKSCLQQNPSELFERFGQVLKSFESRRSLKKRVQEQNREIKLLRPDLLVLGGSTGGTQALSLLLKNFPKECPPILVVQHISKGFAEAFARRLSEVSGIPLGECQKEGPLESNHMYLSFGDYHIGVRKRGTELHLECANAPPVLRHRPSVDYLFHSVAAAQVRSIGVLLTGMGTDGAQGMLKLKNGGSLTFAQDEESSIVFGMPKEAIRLGGVAFSGNIEEIRAKLVQSLGYSIKTKEAG